MTVFYTSFCFLPAIEPFPVKADTFAAATGGLVSYDYVNNYEIHTFINSGTFSVSAPGNVEVLVVAGGGGGGKAEINNNADGAGGGGAGGLIYVASLAVTAGDINVTVGGGGKGSQNYNLRGENGQNSTFGGYNAIGGGGGGSDVDNYPGNGGSGGGAANWYGSTIAGGTSTAGQGYDGGGTVLNSTSWRAGSGGGGAGGAGVARTGGTGGAGGPGLTYNISGAAVIYAKGGNGGDISGSANGATPANYTGSGGGGGSAPWGCGGDGAKGIVIVRFAMSPSTAPYLKGSGGLITYDAVNNTETHTFTADGTLNVTSSGNAEVLIVAGGGGGGNAEISGAGDGAGGGGGGGVIYIPSMLIGAGNFNISVGSGGAGSATLTARGSNGLDSSFAGYTALGGGGGGSDNGDCAGVNRGSDGGSGGGTANCYSGTTVAGNGTSGQGHQGGDATYNSTSWRGGSGGGGAGGPGIARTGAGGAAGGPGITLNISGTAIEYGKGGSGGSVGPGTSGANGSAYTGNGGGGGNSGNGRGGTGGYGVVIIKFRIDPIIFSMSCTGGNLSRVGNFMINTFNASGTLNCPTARNLETLIVAGGGGGGKAEPNPGGDGAGGGGAGGLIYIASLPVNTGNIAVTVGNGGNGSSANNARGNNGENSVFSGNTAIGGGGGGSDNGDPAGVNKGADGGSGGGAANAYSASTAASSGTAGQGYGGGEAVSNNTSWRGGSGGGGAGGAGAARTSGAGGAGGAGVSYSITGTAIVYSRGGNGGDMTSGTRGADAAANTGGGGGGGNSTGSAGNGGNGGSGVVIVKYAYLSPLTAAPGNFAASGITASAVHLTWDATADATGYNIYKCSGIACTPATKIANAVTNLYYDDATLSAGTNYVYQVVGVNADNAEGTKSGTVAVLTLPGVPATIASNSLTAASVRITWAAPSGSVTGYNVYRCSGSACTPAGPALATGVTNLYYDDATLNSNTVYGFKISSVNVTGEGTLSSTLYITSLPGQPAGLGITNLTATGLQLNWTAPDGGADSYKIFRCSGVSCTPQAPAITSGATGLNYDDSGLSANTTYGYKVSAINGIGEGDASITYYVTTYPAAPWSLAVSDLSETVARITWAAPAGGADSYNVYKCSGNACTPTGPAFASGLTDLSYDNTGLTANTVYGFRISAVATAGEGALSSTYYLTTAPAAPGSLASSNITATGARISWSAAGGAVSYKLYKCSGLSCTPSAVMAGGITDTAYTDATLAANSNYVYKVSAINADGTEGTFSSVLPVLTLPGIPGGLASSNVSASGLRISWSAPAGGAATYKVYRCSGASCIPGGAAVSVGITGLNYNDSGLNSGTVYGYKVSAVNASGEGVLSATSYVTTSVIPTAKPSPTPSTSPTGSVVPTVSPTQAPAAEPTTIPVPTVTITSVPAITLTPTVSKPAPTGTISTVIHLSMAGGVDLANTTVELNGNKYITNDKAEFSVVNLPQGTYEVKVVIADKEYRQSLVLGSADKKEKYQIELVDKPQANNIYIFAIGAVAGGGLIWLLIRKRLKG